MVLELLPYAVPVLGLAVCSAWCAIQSCIYARRTRDQHDNLNRRLIALEQAPPKVLIQTAPQPVYPSPAQPKPSAPPSYTSVYPNYTPPYQVQTQV